MSDNHLQLTRPADGVCLIRFERPHARNALSTAMQQALDEMLRELARDRDARAIVLTGAGQAFSSGYDVKEMADFDADAMLLNYMQRQQWIATIAHYPKPLIGAINGPAHGAGAIIATALDIRVGCPQSEFRFTAAVYGGANNTWQLPPVVGFAKAKEFVMTGRRIGADEALQAGLLNHLVDDGAVLDEALKVAGQIAANPPEAVCWHKALIHAHVGRSYGDALDAENTVMNTVLRPGRVAQLFEDFLARSRS